MELTMKKAAPQSGRVLVVYPPSVEGHILGDTYKLYLDGDFRILESSFIPADPGRTEQKVRWTRNRLAGPIYLSLERFDFYSFRRHSS